MTDVLTNQAEEIREFLVSAGIPLLEDSVLSSEEYLSFALPLAADADYAFRLWLHPDGERQISAVIAGTEDTATTELYFWHHPFEIPDYDSIEELNQAFMDTIVLLASHETRIVQEKKALTWEFSCEAKSAGTWRHVFSDVALSFTNFVFPSIDGRTKIYSSPALLAASKETEE